MKTISVFLFFTFILINQALIKYEIVKGGKIITTIKTQDFVELIYIADQTPPNGTCKCEEFNLNSCIVTTINTTGTVQYKHKITYQKSVVSGSCTLRDVNNNIIDNIAFVDDLFLYPSFAPNDTDTVFQIKSIPKIAFGNLERILENMTLVASLNPDISVHQQSGNNFLISSEAKNNITSFYPSIDGLEWQIKFQLEDTVRNEIYKIGKPLTLFAGISISDISPKLSEVGFKSNFLITGNNFVSSSQNALIKFGSGEVFSGTIISSSLISFEHSFSSAGNFTFDVSFDGNNSFINSNSLTVSTFDFTSDITPTYTSTKYSEEIGCSVFGFNNFTLNLYSQIPSTHRDAISLTIIDKSFKRTTEKCIWDDENQKMNCPCPKLSDLTIELPKSFEMELNLNGKEYFPMINSQGNSILLKYFKPRSFHFSPRAKTFNEILPNSLEISGLESYLDTSQFNYTWYLRNKFTAFDIKIPSCTLNDTSNTFSCDLTFLHNTNSNTSYEGYSKLITKATSTLSELCNCKFENTYCLDNATLTNGSCCTLIINNSTNNYTKCESAQISNCFSCELYPVVRILTLSNPNGLQTLFESSKPFYFYRTISNAVISPNAIRNDLVYDLTLTGKPFVQSGDISLRLVSTDYSANINDIQYTSSEILSFKNPILPASSYQVEISQNNLTWKSMNIELNSYDEKNLTFSTIIGDEGVSQTTPAKTTMKLFGTGYVMSSKISIIYNITGLSFEESCTYINETYALCNTPDVYSTGTTLPKDLSVYFAMNGIDYIDTKLTMTFLESKFPVIVLYSPTTGPIRPDDSDPYTITITGITKNVDQCIFTKKGTNIVKYDNNPTVRSSDEVVCTVPTNSINENDYGLWEIVVANTVASQTSVAKEFTLYPKPVVTSISPNFGVAYGGVDISLIGSGFHLLNQISLDNLRATFRITTIRSSIDCKILSDTMVNCTTPSHPEDKTASIYLSYNEKNFVSWSGITYDVQSCKPGEFGSNYEVPCQICPAGKYKHKEGFFECIECEENRYQPETGSTTCLKCPTLTKSVEGSKNLTNCDCQSGAYRKNGTNSGIECSTCVKGGICDGGSSLPRPKEGYYWIQDDIEPFNFVICNTQSFCTGNTSLNGGCIIGRTGLLCENCASGYYKSSGKCEICNTDVQWRMIGVIIVLFILILLFFKFAQLKVSHLSSFSIAISYYQIIAVFSAYNFKWPDALKNVLGYLKFLNLDLDIFVPECISSITYGMKWGATLAIPVVFAILLFLGFILEVIRSLLARIYGRLIRKMLDKFYKIDRRNWLTVNFSSTIVATIDFFADPKSIKQLGEFGDKCIHTFVIILSFSYVFVVTKASQIFNCVTVKDQLLMDSERSVQCYQGDWWIYFPFAIATLITFGLGVIGLFAYVLLFKKKIQASKTFNARFRFLFVRFRDERIYWQIIIIIRKLLISTAIIFFSGYPLLVVLFSMLVIFIAFILQIHNVPYRRDFHNTMEYIVLLSTELLLFCALLFYVDDFPKDWSKDLVGVLCIIVIVVSSISVGGLIVLDFILQFFEDKKQTRVQYLESIHDLDIGKDISMAEQDVMLATFGLKRRANQTTVIIGEQQKDEKFDISATQQVELDENLESNEDFEQEKGIIPKLGSQENSSPDSIHHDRINSNTGLLFENNETDPKSSEDFKTPPSTSREEDSLNKEDKTQEEQENNVGNISGIAEVEEEEIQ
eukprot:gene2882-4725_t